MLQAPLSSLLLLSRLLGSIAFVPVQVHRSSLLKSRPIGHQPTLRAFDDDEDEIIDLGNQDWRAFRAKLVLSEPLEASVSARTIGEGDECIPDSGQCDLDDIGSLFNAPKQTIRWDLTTSMNHQRNPTTTVNHNRSSRSRPVYEAARMAPSEPTRWAYESGKMVEQGAVVLGGVEQEVGFGLRQQYFHKAAILVLEHDETTFTKGILLNRPTNLVLDDDLNPGAQWRVWFGGDVQGLMSPNPDIVCLHQLTDPRVTDASVPVMNGLQWTTFENAKQLVHAGYAKPQDFWVFVGYSGWGPGQLMNELDRSAWHMVATDSQTLLKELGRQSADADVRDAGLDTWKMLMKMIGRGETAELHAGGFDDLMLKEWALDNLLSEDAGGGALRKNPVSRLLNRAQASGPQQVPPGTLVRGSSVDRSPFLLKDQELHKSVVLILSDDDKLTVGAILNRPSSKGLDIQRSKSSKISIPLRFGGQFSVKGSEPLLWLHSNPVLRSANVGEPLGPRINGIWKCTVDDVTTAISQGWAAAEEFFVITGVTVWNKDEHGGGGIQGEIRAGKFEVVPDYQTQDVWDALAKQEVLSSSNLQKNLKVAEEAWSVGKNIQAFTPHRNTMVSISGMRDDYDEKESVVFESNMPVSKLSDDALQMWIATFLLGTSPLGSRLEP